MKKVLISQCLIGENVRYDGGNCLVTQLNELKEKYDLVPVCPELLAGLGVPREPIERVGDEIITKSGVEITSSFIPVFETIEKMIEENKIEMAIMKENSPSCGVHKVYDGSFSGVKIDGSGLISEKLRSLGLKVYSDQEILLLLNDTCW